MGENISKLEKLIIEKDITDAQVEAIIDQIKNPDLTPKTFKHYWGTKRIRIGLMSDTHIGSKYQDLSVLEDIFKRFKKEKVEAIYIAGDITEGYNMRPGHSFECSLHGADEQIKGVVDNIPSNKKQIYFITGDHDHSHFKRQGIDVGIHIDERRKDMHYLGMFNATIKLAKNTSLMLVHPAKGTAYAISYHPQKMVESFSGGEKPNILAIGHYHKIENLFYRNIHVYQTGCIQSQTGWMKRMNLSAHKGAWIVDLFLKENGTIDKLENKLLAYY